MANIFSKRPVEVPNKSAFDLSHRNCFTTKCGTITPCLVDELLPGDKVSLGAGFQVQLPPMAADFYGRVRARIEAFFVPNRLLFGGWKTFIENADSRQISGDFENYSILPGIEVDSVGVTANKAMLGAGTLADYLGFKSPQPIVTGETTTIRTRIPNILPFMAYHKIYDDWYRDSRIQVPLFKPFMATVSLGVKSLPSSINNGSSVVEWFSTTSSTQTQFSDGVNIMSLRQRCWSKDYFTNATTQPQAGSESNVTFSTSGDTGTFSIAQLRAANSLQQWKERMNISGRYGDRIQAQFGVYPSDAVTDRSIYLGSMTIDVYNKSVYQTATNSGDSTNEFNAVGSKYASAQAVGNGSLIDEFEAKEYGFLFVNFTLMPDAQYSTGTRRYLSRSKIGDYAWPVLAGVGDQAIYQSELDGYGGYVMTDSTTVSPKVIFGYTQRYSDYKFMNDEVHGLLRNGENLSQYALQRYFSYTSHPTVNSAFITIPTNAMDNITSTTADISNFGCWVDSGWSYKKVSTLPAYSIPTLGDIKNTHTISVDSGGKRL